MKIFLLVISMLLVGCSEDQSGAASHNPIPTAVSGQNCLDSTGHDFIGTFRLGAKPGEWMDISMWGGSWPKLTMYHDDFAWLSILSPGISIKDEDGNALGLSPSSIHFYEAGGERQTILSTDGLSIGGARVVGPRLAAIADATSPEDMVVKFNLLLAALRTHGLIERGAGR